jgi:hypothetical protein
MNKKRSNNFDLINLKLELHNLDHGCEQLYNKYKIKLDSIKRLGENHQHKRLQFVNRVKFFDNFLLNDLNRKIKLLKNQIESTQKINQELDIEYINLRQEIYDLNEKKFKLNEKISRYFKFYQFLNSSVIRNHFCNDLTTMINKYDSLIFTKKENKINIDARINELAKIKNEIRSIVSSEYLIQTYETKNFLSNKLINLRGNILDLNQYNQTRVEILNTKNITMHKIELEIDYLYNLTCLMRSKNKNKSIIKNDTNLLCTSSLSLFEKMDIIHYNLINFSELAKLNV